MLYCYSIIPISPNQFNMPFLEVAVLLREILYPVTIVASGSKSAISPSVPDQPLPP